MGPPKNEGVSTKDHFEERLKSVERLEDARWKAHEEVHAMGQRAFDTAMARTDDKFDSVNKFREQVLEERSMFLRRETYDTEYGALEKKVAEQQKWIDNMTGRLWALGVVVLAINVGVGLVIKFWGR